ncbi:hypothetical protein DPEC_G00301840 [Dallia pectoralis]|uniref:Uncharacterized protein n=1 Tax=Dallia pectoralis TaxID=75939 RepID=A0ACC2FGL0_DALPE|nr:hypothetical protein DPEC_G00301840 [Dallia pectoralis]
MPLSLLLGRRNHKAQIPLNVLRPVKVCSLMNLHFFCVNKHKPWIETSYHGVITENTDIVLLDPPLVALDKDAPLAYAGYRGLQSSSLETVLTAPSGRQFLCVAGPREMGPDVRLAQVPF